jgi:hypothetical protein
VADPSGVSYELQLSRDPAFPEDWLEGGTAVSLSRE